MDNNKEIHQCHHIGLYYRDIHNSIDRYFACNSSKWQGLKLTHSQCNIMRYLYEHRNEDVFQKDLEAEFHISGATASNTLKGMEKQKVIVREQIPTDARKKKISLTTLGAEAHEQATANINSMEAALIKGMSEEEITTLRGLLERSIQNLDEITENSGDKK